MFPKTYTHRCPGVLSRICPVHFVYVLQVSIEILYVLEHICPGEYVLVICPGVHIYVLGHMSWRTKLYLYVLGAYMSWGTFPRTYTDTLICPGEYVLAKSGFGDELGQTLGGDIRETLGKL